MHNAIGPPYRRAEVLLQEMTALTARLSELAGNKPWQESQYQSNFPTLSGSAVVPSEDMAALPTKEVLLILESHQKLLVEAGAQVSELMDNDQEKQQIAEAIAVKHAAMRNFAKRVRDAEKVLESTMEEFEEYRKPKRVEKGCRALSRTDGEIDMDPGTINVQELVAYAHRISYTTFAPPDFASGQVPLRGALPPAPQEEQMRASQLYYFSDMDVGLQKPEAPAIPLVPILDSAAEAGNMKVEAAGTLQATHAPVAMPAAIPLGWQPGMPIELPPELPPMPSGWKPGDPIPLPPGLEFPIMPQGWKHGDAVSLPPPPPPPSLPSEPSLTTPVLAPAVSVSPAINQGVIHVPFVQLDLNPELEDEYGSDYTDDDESSEDDED